MNNMKKNKAFTLAEIFIAMVVLSILVSVCVTFFTTKKDYQREFFYYSAYKNLVNVVDSALANETYFKDGGFVQETTLDGKRIRSFVPSPASGKNLCDIFADYFNTAEIESSSGTTIANCTLSTTSPAGNVDNRALELTNGMSFYFSSYTPASIGVLSEDGYTIWVDINRPGEGEDILYYDVMPFYITLTGKVVPGYGQVNGLRGYEFSPAALDGGGNASLMAFDVVYTEADKNSLTVLPGARSISFVEAACKAGYIADSTTYCTGAGGITKDATICNQDYADCKIRLVKKLKRVK